MIFIIVLKSTERNIFVNYLKNIKYNLLKLYFSYKIMIIY